MLKRIYTACAKRIKKKVCAAGSWVFDKKTDALLYDMGLEARKIVESYPLETRQRILYFPTYHHSKFMALADATTALALQCRGVEVIPVLSGFFYQQEDVVYGGVYNSNRFLSQTLYAEWENTLFTRLLKTEPVSLQAFASSFSDENARRLANSATIDSYRSLEYMGCQIGLEAEKLVLNMNLHPSFGTDPDHLRQLRWHIYNIARLYDASAKIMDVVAPSAIVSNVPFYYKWRAPYTAARQKNIPFYSYSMCERTDSFIWTNDSAKMYDSSACWELFYSSGFWKQHGELVDSSIAKRKRGEVTHIPYLNPASQSPQEVERIRAKVSDRPAVLFPVNQLTDAAVLVAGAAFSSCPEMIGKVLAFFQDHPEYVCLLKAHPAEKLFEASEQDTFRLHQFVQREFGALPENIIFIPYDTKVTSFDLYPLVHGLIAYSSSTCMEISWEGKEVISIDRSHYAAAGFAYVPTDENDFFQKLDSVLRSPKMGFSKEIQSRGRAYYLLYHYIVQIKMGLVSGNDLGTTPARLSYNNLDALKPGTNEALDYICDSITNQKPIFGDNRWPPITL